MCPHSTRLLVSNCSCCWLDLHVDPPLPEVMATPPAGCYADNGDLVERPIMVQRMVCSYDYSEDLLSLQPNQLLRSNQYCTVIAAHWLGPRGES